MTYSKMHCEQPYDVEHPHSDRTSPIVSFLAFLAICWCSGCNQDQIEGPDPGCRSNQDCASGEICDPDAREGPGGKCRVETAGDVDAGEPDARVVDTGDVGVDTGDTGRSGPPVPDVRWWLDARDVDSSNPDGCLPLTDSAICKRDGKECGTYTADDGCGEVVSVDCGSTCPGDEQCGARKANVCGCACRIDGKCYALGDPKPGATCKGCNPARSRTKWTGLPHCAGEVAAGRNHTCITEPSGKLHCWGNDTDGQASPPTGSYVEMSAGNAHTCAIDKSAALRCWGGDQKGQSSEPSGSFVQVSAGGLHTCAIDKSNKLHCWGDDDHGQSSPPSGSFAEVSAGGSHSCAIDDANKLHCWGDDSKHQSTPPPGTFKTVSSGRSHSCAIDSTSKLHCWGDNSAQQLSVPPGSYADVNAGGTHTCATDTNGHIKCWGKFTHGRNAPPSGTASSLTAGGNHTCAIGTSNQLHCWGRDEYTEATLPFGPFTDVSAGPLYSCAIDSARKLHCWGESDLPDFRLTRRFVDVDVGQSHSCAVDISGQLRCKGHYFRLRYAGSWAPAGNFTEVGTGRNHTCAIETNGRIRCVGNQSVSICDSFGNYSTSVSYPTPPTRRFKKIDAGYFHTCGIDTSNNIECWGWDIPIDWGGRYDCLNKPSDADFRASVKSASFTELAAGKEGSVGIDKSGRLHGWKSAKGGPSTPWSSGASRKITRVDKSESTTCTIDASNQLECIGGTTGVTRPSGSYTDVSTSIKAKYPAGSGRSGHDPTRTTCAITTSGQIRCWQPHVEFVSF